MRRFIAAITGKRDKQDKQDSKSRSDLKPARSPIPPQSPSRLQVQDTASQRGRSTTTASACSSDQSNLSLPQTTDDDIRDTRPSTWASWTSRKSIKGKSTLKPHANIEANRSTPDLGRSEKPTSSHQRRGSTPPIPSTSALKQISRASMATPATPPSGHSRRPSANSIVESETESESDDGSSESDEDVVITPKQRSERLSIHPNDIQKARKGLYSFTVASLAPTPTTSPFLAPSQPIVASFPRSMMSAPCPCRQQPTLRATVAKKRILMCLDKVTLSSSEQQSILPFAQPGRPILEAPSTKPDALPAYQRIRSNCPGLRQWIDRPCFEERTRMWLLQDGKLISRDIPGSKRAVAALELSEGIEALALAGEEILPVAPIIVTSPSPVSSPQTTRIAPQLTLNLPSSGIVRDSSFDSFPPSSSTATSTSSTSPSPSPGPATPPAVPTQLKRGVRFQQEVEEVDEDDLIPLGVTLKARREAEERERWIWAERERKEKEAEARAAAEAARKRQYVEELAATRRRREEHRAGFKPRGDGERSASLEPPKSQAKSSRPTYDSRRSTSPTLHQPPHVRPRTISKGSSGSLSRPLSYASSSDDVTGFYSPSRASSSGSISGMTPSPTRSSFAGSTDDLKGDRRSSLINPDSVPRARKPSSARSGSSRRQSEIPLMPQVPFLARNWDMPEMPLPPQTLMQQGPFMASVRSQKQSSLRQSMSSDRVDSFGVVDPQNRPNHPRHNSENSISGSVNHSAPPVPNLTFQPYDYRQSLYGSRPRLPNTLDTGRRGTMIF